MPHPIITQYPFNHSSSIGVEAKSLEFLWEKADMTNGIHRADFYHFIWVKGGELCLMVDFEELRLKEEDAFLIAPGQVCQFHLYPHLHSRPEGYSLLFVPEFLGESTTDTQLLHQLLNSNPLARKAISLQQLPIAGLLQQLLCELDRENDNYQLIIARSCLRILLAEVARRLPDERGKSNELAQRFFNEVEEHHHRWYNVSDLQHTGGQGNRLFIRLRRTDQLQQILSETYWYQPHSVQNETDERLKTPGFRKFTI